MMADLRLCSCSDDFSGYSPWPPESGRSALGTSQADIQGQAWRGREAVRQRGVPRPCPLCQQFLAEFLIVLRVGTRLHVPGGVIGNGLLREDTCRSGDAAGSSDFRDHRCLTRLEEALADVGRLRECGGLGRLPHEREACLTDEVRCHETGDRAGGEDRRVADVICRCLVLDPSVGLVGDQRSVGDAVYVDPPGDVVAPEVRLREDVVIVQFLQANVLTATPVPGVVQGQQAEQSAVDRAGVAG